MSVFTWIKLHGTVITGAVVALLNLLVAYGVDLSQDQAAAVATIAGALVTLAGFIASRPISVSHIVAAVTTVVGALAAFHFHPTPDQITTASTVLTLILTALFGYFNVPVTAARRGTTAAAMQGVPQLVSGSQSGAGI